MGERETERECVFVKRTERKGESDRIPEEVDKTRKPERKRKGGTERPKWGRRKETLTDRTVAEGVEVPKDSIHTRR